MLYAKIQGSEPILLDQTQLTEESKSFNVTDFIIFVWFSDCAKRW